MHLVSYAFMFVVFLSFNSFGSLWVLALLVPKALLDHRIVVHYVFCYVICRLSRLAASGSVGHGALNHAETGASIAAENSARAAMACARHV